MSAVRKIKSATGFDKKEVNQVIECMKDPQNTHITADEVFDFYEKYIPDDKNIVLELKYILARSEMEGSESILKFLKEELDFEVGKDLLLKEFSSILEDTLHFQKSSCDNLYDEIKTVRPNIWNPNIVDFYLLILNQRDEELVRDQQLDKNEIKIKVADFLKSKYPKQGDKAITCLSEDSEFTFDAKSKETLALYDFIEVF
jgi:hypothetical protein